MKFIFSSKNLESDSDEIAEPGASAALGSLFNLID
jgi:hypothetical protein